MAALRRSPDTAWQRIGDETVIMNLAKACVIGLNPTGALLWSILEEHDEDGLARAISERFEVDPQTARQDVREFLDLLRRQGLVVEE